MSSIGQDESKPLSGIKDDLPYALLAFVIWGGWTYYANAQAGYWTALISACAQGLFSMVMTFFMGYLTCFFFVRLTHPMAQLLMPATLILTLSGTCLTVLHWLVGTPEIILTIMPALIVGFLFCLFKTIQLKRKSMYERS